MNQYTEYYFNTALWSSVDENGSPLDDKYSLTDLAPETIERAEKDIDAFIATIEKQGLDTSDHKVSQLMHDFWLTRNGHGAGFWDGDYEESLGEALTKLSETFGEIDLYVGDDSLLYFM